MAFAGRYAQDAASRAEQILKSAAPTIRLAESVANHGMFQDIIKTQTKVMQSAMPQPILVQSLAAGGMFQDIIKTQTKVMQSIVPQVNMWQWAGPSEVLQDILDMQVGLAAVPQSAHADSLSNTEPGLALSRDSQRLLFGYFAYCVVWSLVIVAYIRVMGASEADSRILSLFTFGTGVSAPKIAAMARDAAFRLYDSWDPPE